MSVQDKSWYVVYTQYYHNQKWCRNSDQVIKEMTPEEAKTLAADLLREARKPFGPIAGGLVSFGKNDAIRRARILRVAEEIFIE